MHNWMYQLHALLRDTEIHTIINSKRENIKNSELHYLYKKVNLGYDKYF